MACEPLLSLSLFFLRLTKENLAQLVPPLVLAQVGRHPAVSDLRFGQGDPLGAGPPTRGQKDCVGPFSRNCNETRFPASFGSDCVGEVTSCELPCFQDS